jgi:hypothetical protein
MTDISLFLLDGDGERPGQNLRHQTLDPNLRTILNQILVHVGVTLGELAESAMLIELKKSSWASMRGGDLRIDKSTTEIDRKDAFWILPPVPDTCLGLHLNYWAVACLFQILSNTGQWEKGGLCRRRRACESVHSQFSAPASRKHRHWPPPHRRSP